MNRKLCLVACLLPMVTSFMNIGYTMESKYKQANNIENLNNSKIIGSIEKEFQKNKNIISPDLNIKVNDICNTVINISNIYLLPKINSSLKLIVKQCIFDINDKFILHRALSEMIITAIEARDIIQNSSDIDNYKNFYSIINTIVELENESLKLVKEQINNIIELCKDDNNTKVWLKTLNKLFNKLYNTITNIMSKITSNSQKIKEIIKNGIENEKNSNLLNTINNTIDVLTKFDKEKFLNSNDEYILSSMENITENYFNTLLNNLKYRLNLHKQYHNENIKYLEDNTNYNDGKIHVQYLQYKNLYNNIINFIKKCNNNGDEVWENIPNFIQNELKQVLFNNYDNNKIILNEVLNDTIDEILLKIYHNNIISPLSEIQNKLTK